MSSDPSDLRRVAHDPRPEARRAARAELEQRRLPLFEDPGQAARNQELRHRCGMSTLFSPEDKAAKIRELVEQGAQPFAVDDAGIGPVHRVATEGPVAALATLLELGATLAAVDGQGWTVLHHACGSLGPRDDVRVDGLPKRRELIAWLLERGLDPRTKDAAGRTALHYAAAYLDAACCAPLLAAGAEIEAPSDQGTALGWAVLMDNHETVELLLARGAAVAPSLLARAEEKSQSRMLARLKARLGVEDDAADPEAALVKLKALARKLGREHGSAAVATGDYDYGQEVGNDVEDLIWSAWEGSAEAKLAEAFDVLGESVRRALGDREAVLEGLSPDYSDGWRVGLDD
jgi:hypothetical protein